MPSQGEEIVDFVRARVEADEAWAAATLSNPYAFERYGYARRIQAEAEAKRLLLEQHLGYGDGDDRDLPVRTLTLLALPYAAHPDYDERWRP